MQNLKYLEKVIDEDTRFGVILNETAMRHKDHIQLKMAISLLEFFNSGKFVNEIDINKIENVFYVSKVKYFKPKVITKTKVFSVRVNLGDSEEDINSKLSELQNRIRKFTS
ncbi:MAG: hypothetical protein QIT40_gp01 [Lokiarchaeia virus VerdaV4]|uniref:Uncharacterized protein n=1 Tax=Lokiarchaeia virus VerdaV4 TaxID=3070172 RepID=A0AA35CPL1_9CAUD|nr:MAG: hypothetical protein QIT40_gp01 [Lokiarchaeia virus VerdaV4]BDI54959.1 MAG: hypothetical protein [Lokiarchaeia virus VerdaV4]